MLLEISVKNFAIIDSLAMEFGPGFNVLSGETGAGKSIILKSLTLLMGDKTSPNAIRSGRDFAVVQGLFDISLREDILLQIRELGFEADDEQLVVRRLISSTGKNRVYINDHLCSLNTLKGIVAPLIEINGDNQPLIEMTGQHENKNLLNRNLHLEVVDNFLDGGKLRNDYETHYRTFVEAKKKVEELESQELVQQQRLDYLRFQQQEFGDIQLAKGDVAKIEADYHRYKNQRQISSNLAEFNYLLSEADNSLVNISNKLSKITDNLAQFDPWWKENQNLLEQLQTMAEDLAYTVNSRISENADLENDSEQIEERISSLRKLQKKFGESEEELLAAQQEIQDEIDELENRENEIKKWHEIQKDSYEIARNLSQKLSAKRKDAINKLTSLVNAELKDLNMKGVNFDILWQKLPEMSPRGSDDIEFALQSEKNGPHRPLNKTASGGELSRILLAIKTVTGKGQMPRTYLFDEVDAGISGKTAEKVGRKLKSISKGQQLICVTHLPQVAAFADLHFAIEKSNTKGEVRLKVKSLTEADRENEIARLLSGEKVSATGLKHAKSLLNQCRH